MDSSVYECYVEKVRKAFREVGLNGEDIYRIANTLNKLQQYYGSDQCWDIASMRQLERGFTLSNQYCTRYKGKNANPLILAVYNIFPVKEKEETILIRKGICKNFHCINPRHLFYGDKIDLKIEKWQRNGIDIDKYNLLLESQNYKCAICGSKETGRIDIKYFNVDHCHKTGKIRGLLCHSCNRMLGDAKDDPNILSKGIDYLKG